jgi:hypothetical protein
MAPYTPSPGKTCPTTSRTSPSTCRPRSSTPASTSNDADCSPDYAANSSPGGCTLIRTGAFPCHSKWQALVATLEATLRLHRHQPATLVKLAKYLHQRTGGMIGSLSHLIRAVAITAILDGSEGITRTLLDAVPLDHCRRIGRHRTTGRGAVALGRRQDRAMLDQ